MVCSSISHGNAVGRGASTGGLALRETLDMREKMPIKAGPNKAFDGLGRASG